MKKLSIIGLGKMGSAILNAVLQTGHLKKSDIAICVRNESQKTRLISEGFSCVDLPTAYANAQYVILAVKPQSFPEVLAQLSNMDCQGTVVSIAAGISLDYLTQHLGDIPCVRTMPNTPVSVGCGVVAVCRNAKVTDEMYQSIFNLLQPLGMMVHIEEEMMDDIIPLCGSMPAFLWTFLKGFLECAVARGIPAEMAQRMLIQTVMGSAVLTAKSNESLASLIQAVCSPKGTTLAGLEALESHHFNAAISACFDACANRSKAIAEQLSK